MSVELRVFASERADPKIPLISENRDGTALNERKEDRMMRRTAKLLLDARNGCLEIESITECKTEDAIWNDRILQLSLHRLLDIVGEALHNAHTVDPEGATAIPGLQEFMDVRSHIQDDYDSVDYAVVWRSAVQHIPPLRVALDDLLETAPSLAGNSGLAQRLLTIEHVIPLVSGNKDAIANLCRKFHIKKLDIFGSAVTGSFDPDASDLDFVVDLGGYEHGVAGRYFGFADALEELFGRKVDLVTGEQIRNPYLRQAVEEQRVNVYEARNYEAVA